MNGILEQILAAIQANTAAINAHGQLATQASNMPGVALANGPAPVLSAPPAPPQNVTDETLMALIQPHLSNEPLKAELGVVMRGMGINGLPEVQPHQYGPLYQAFQGVIAKFTGGATAAPASNLSII